MTQWKSRAELRRLQAAGVVPPDAPSWAVGYLKYGEDGDSEWLCEHAVGHGGVHTCDGCCVAVSSDLKEKLGICPYCKLPLHYHEFEFCTQAAPQPLKGN